MRARVDAELELIRRGLPRGRTVEPFDAWLGTVTPAWRWEWRHLAYVRRYLQGITDGSLKRLMVLMPPRHGKTEQNTVRYPVWRLERDPTLRVIIGAYNQTLASKFGRKARRIARDRVALATDRVSAEDWETTAGGGVRSVGVGGGITGQGGDLILIDDPIKSREEAESLAYRDRCWDWYTNDLYTRLEPGGSIVLTLTPWHSDDIAGRILASEEGPTWTVVRLPALAAEADPLGREPGEALCPERFDAGELARTRRVVGSYAFQALYQCSPQPAEGGLFKRHWLRYWKREGEYLRLVRPDGTTAKLIRASECRRFATVDLAFSLRTSADYTVICAWGVDEESNLVLLDMDRDRIDGPDLVPRIRRMYERHDLDYVGVEDTQAQALVVKYARKDSIPARSLFPDRDKVTRSITAQVRMEAGQIYLPADHPDIAAVETELLTFPTGVHDDIVDNVAYGAIEVMRFGPGPETPEQLEAGAKAEADAKEAEAAARLGPFSGAMWGDSDDDD